MMARGYSPDHRPDCEQMVIALIVNREGFPFSYETFNGNRADVSTMETILRMVERKYGKARRIWVLDRGLLTLYPNLRQTGFYFGLKRIGLLFVAIQHFQQFPLETGKCRLVVVRAACLSPSQLGLHVPRPQPPIAIAASLINTRRQGGLRRAKVSFRVADHLVETAALARSPSLTTMLRNLRDSIRQATPGSTSGEWAVRLGG